MDSIILKEVETILADALSRVSKVLSGQSEQRPARDPELTLDRHVAALLREVDRPLSVNQISDAIGAAPASVRGVLYANREVFERAPLSPGRMRWKLKSVETSASASGCTLESYCA